METRISNGTQIPTLPKVPPGEDSVHEMVGHVFEIVDVTDEEAYFTVGIFLTLADAVTAIESESEPWQLCESAMFSGEYASMEIRRRKVGLDPLNNGDVVWSRKWVNRYMEDADDNEWRIFDQPNASMSNPPSGASGD